MTTCPNCHAQQPEGALFCDNCGATLGAAQPATPFPPTVAVRPMVAPAVGPASSNVCPVCGAPTVPGEAFCDNCGAALGAAPAAPVAAPAMPSPPMPSAPVIPPAPAPAPAAVTTCPACGAVVEPGSAFCDMCGAKLSAAAPIPPTVPVSTAPAPAYTPPQVPAPGPTYTPPQAPVPEPAYTPPQAPVPGPAYTPPVAPPPSPYTPPPGAGPAPSGVPYPPPPAQQPAATPGYPPPTAPAMPSYVPPAGAGQPRLMVQSTHATLPLPAGKAEIVIGREDPVSSVFPDIDLTNHGGDEGGVSRRHARLLVRGNQIYLEDLNSTNFTYVNQQRLTPGQPQLLNNGDEIRLGKVRLNFYL